MRIKLLPVVLAAALAAIGCASAPPVQPLAQGEVLVDLDSTPCRVDPKWVAIDWDPAGTLAKEVTWIRSTTGQNAHFAAKAEEKHKDLFRSIPGKFGWLKKTKRSGPPVRVPPWNDDYDNSPDSYTFRYEVKKGNQACDPEICIRKNETGCSSPIDED